MRDDIPLRECITGLKRHKPAHSQPPLVSVLVQQLISFKTNPDSMRRAYSRYA
jgi:hypothetical protein